MSDHGGNLQPMSDPYRVRPEHRAIAASLYDNWRCACGWNGDDFWIHIQAELDSIAAERDRARDLAAHLEAEVAALHRVNDMLAKTLGSALTIMRGINMDTPEDQELHERAIDTLAGALDLKAHFDACPAAHLEAEQAEED